MSNMVKWLQVGTTVLDVAANLSNARISETQGKRIAAAREFEAAQAEERALEAFAVSQRLALEEARNAEYVASRAIAVAGASGAGVTDPTVLNVITRIKSEGALRAAYRLYEGEAAARKLRREGAVLELEGNDALLAGDNRKRAYQFQAIGALSEGTSSLYARYGIGPQED